MASSGMLRRVALVRTEDSEEFSTSLIRVIRVVEIGTMLVKTSIVPISSIFLTLMKETLISSESSVLTKATQNNIPEDAILLYIGYFVAIRVQLWPLNYKFKLEIYTRS
jgi:hypothetical protein